jgi:hydrogenase maturation factor
MEDLHLSRAFDTTPSTTALDLEQEPESDIAILQVATQSAALEAALQDETPSAAATTESTQSDTQQGSIAPDCGG